MKLKELDFPQQLKFVEDHSQFLAALCTRRAGKTNALGLRFIKTMIHYPGSLSRYIALTRDSAKDIMWPVLEELNERRNLKAELTESNLTMKLPNGSRLRLMGADMKNFVRRLRGAKCASIAVDEAQEFAPDHLENLVDEILTPSIADYPDSWLALTGTPGPIPRGLFFEATQGGQYSNHSWSLYDNPYLPNARDFVEKLKLRKKWDDRNPTFLREYMGQWVLDLDSLVIRYDKELNHYEKLPTQKYVYVMGIDIGFTDADAIAVVAWSHADRKTYLVEEIVAHKQGLTELVGQIETLRSKYEIAKLVIDEGGLGKKLAEEMRRRYRIPVQAADKARKMENIEILNDELRTGNFKAKKDSRFAQDSYQLQIDHDKTTPSRIVVKSGFHSDIIDAVLYAFKESWAFTHQAPIAKPKYGTEEWAEQQASEMEQRALEHFENLEKAETGFGYE